MKTRNGDIYIKLKKRYGDISPITDLKDNAYKKERDGGNYGMATKERQEKNYREKKELEKKRREMFQDGLKLFNEKKFDVRRGEGEGTRGRWKWCGWSGCLLSLSGPSSTRSELVDRRLLCFFSLCD